MNKERFNQLLGDPNQVTNEDIKSLNELRKKYPFFQTPYVIVAKALKDRKHPKTDAFIKKAAIYSPNRSYLKKVIMGEISFNEEPSRKKQVTKQPVQGTQEEANPQQKSAEKAEAQVTEIPKKAEIKETESAPSIEMTAKITENPSLETTLQPSAKGVFIEQLEGNGIPSEEELSEQTKEIHQLEKDLLEIRARKQMLARMLDGQEEEKRVQTEIAKKPNKSQVELIEKFIKNEPRFENKKGEFDGKEYVQEDLATKHLKHKDEFITETLADLLVKQEKYNRAVDIYEKLCLKFPEKRAYFASQIQKIKDIKNV